MLPELGKVNKQMENPFVKGKLQEGHIQEISMVVDETEKIMETSETFEVYQKELEGGMKVLLPNIELIKTQSLETIKQNNIEKIQASIKEDHELRELTEEEKQYLKENTRLSENVIESICIDAEGNYHLKCRNEELADKSHEVTGVKYVKKTIIVDDIEITVVVPEFEATFECEIPVDMWEEGDREIFKNCTEQLRDYIEAHPEMKSQFSEQQLEQIMNGEPYIKGYTWHHSEIPGKMQLVEAKTHAMSGHTGGNLIWCGGIR